MQEEGKENDSTAGVPEVPGVEDRGINMNEDERIIEPANSLPEVKLEDLPEQLQTACARAGWARLLPVQSRAIPYVLAKRNLMVQSQTGSGKTAAFVLPILARIDPGKRACQALVLVPTRELAGQVSREAETLGAEMAIRTAVVYGGDPSLRPSRQAPSLSSARRAASWIISSREPFPSGSCRSSYSTRPTACSPWAFTPT
jgi:superfamily II DNA/RNA helicase